MNESAWHHVAKGGERWGTATRRSLLIRLRNWDDNESWRFFFETYWRLIYNTARRAGMQDVEAQDIVQETVISVLKSISRFNYDSDKGSFKAWLLTLTRRRINDRLRQVRRNSVRQPEAEDAEGRIIVEEIPDPSIVEIETVWDQEWERNLLEAALDRVKAAVDPKHYQIFDLLIFQNWTPAEIVKVMHVKHSFVRLVKHRVQERLRVEVSKLRKEPILIEDRALINCNAIESA
jgi:RNA polymerase sigma-70 factor (ECF subfamily)